MNCGTQPTIRHQAEMHPMSRLKLKKRIVRAILCASITSGVSKWGLTPTQVGDPGPPVRAEVLLFLLGSTHNSAAAQPCFHPALTYSVQCQQCTGSYHLVCCQYSYVPHPLKLSMDLYASFPGWRKTSSSPSMQKASQTASMFVCRWDGALQPHAGRSLASPCRPAVRMTHECRLRLPSRVKELSCVPHSRTSSSARRAPALHA